MQNAKLSKDIIQAFRGRGRRSSLYWWMRENYAELKAAKGEGRTDWKGFVVELARLGLTDINNKPPNLQTAQRTWYRVVKDMATKPEPKLEPIPKPLPPPILPTSHGKTVLRMTDDQIRAFWKELNDRSYRYDTKRDR